MHCVRYGPISLVQWVSDAWQSDAELEVHKHNQQYADHTVLLLLCLHPLLLLPHPRDVQRLDSVYKYLLE